MKARTAHNQTTERDVIIAEAARSPEPVAGSVEPGAWAEGDCEESGRCPDGFASRERGNGTEAAPSCRSNGEAVTADFRREMENMRYGSGMGRPGIMGRAVE
jgi:hypothetical protein